MSAAERTVLVVEDDPGVRTQIRWAFEEEYEVVLAKDRREAIEQLRRHEPAVVALDLGLPPDAHGSSEGLETLREIMSLAPRTKVIVITGNDERATAVDAVARGAYDYYQKPIDPDLLRIVVDRAFRMHDLELENRLLVNDQATGPMLEIVGVGSAVDDMRRKIEKVAPSEATTCIVGESGTGKELVARALHRLSRRADKRFVPLNCAAIPESLLESELFGYERGAFTGAHQRTVGRIENANGGTLFLDEIGDLPAILQAKLLRFLQERVIERLGSRQEIPVDVRVVSATNRDLDHLMADGTFREDLYYRLSEVTIRVPPLREREGDAGIIARMLLERFAAQQNRRVPTLTADALRAIDSYRWPGNVRELENRVKRAVIMAEGTTISAAELELDAPEEQRLPFNLREVRERAERQALARVLRHGGNNLSRAAGLLGVTRPTLYALLDKYDMRPVREEADEASGEAG